MGGSEDRSICGLPATLAFALSIPHQQLRIGMRQRMAEATHDFASSEPISRSGYRAHKNCERTRGRTVFVYLQRRKLSVMVVTVVWRFGCGSLWTLRSRTPGS